MRSGICCVKGDASLWGGMPSVYYVSQAVKEVKIESRIDFIVVVF